MQRQRKAPGEKRRRRRARIRWDAAVRSGLTGPQEHREVFGMCDWKRNEQTMKGAA